MEKHRNELLKICRVCQIQLTKPFYSLRLVISVDSLRNLIFPYDCNLYPTNVCQQCKRKVEKEVTRFQAFRKKLSINKLKKAETTSVGESYIDHIGGIENIGVKSGSFWPHSDLCSLCKSNSSNLEDDIDDEFQTPPGSPIVPILSQSTMDLEEAPIFTSTPVHSCIQSNNRRLDEDSFNINNSEYGEDIPVPVLINDQEDDNIIIDQLRSNGNISSNNLGSASFSVNYSEHAEELPYDQESFMVVEHEVVERNVNEVGAAYITPHKKSALKGQIPMASPVDHATQNTTKDFGKGHRTLNERFKTYLKSTKKKK